MSSVWNILKFAYCAWQSRPISLQKCFSSAAAWSKKKRLQSPQSARVIPYLGHTNWETGDAKWHHYSKCSPSFDFLCISVRLLKMLFIQDGNVDVERCKIKEASEARSLNLIWGSLSFALLSEDQTSFFDLAWFGGTLGWGHRDCRGWLLSKWLGYEWEHSLSRKYQTGLNSCFWMIRKKKSGKSKMLLMSSSFIWLICPSKDSLELDLGIFNTSCTREHVWNLSFCWNKWGFTRADVASYLWLHCTKNP